MSVGWYGILYYISVKKDNSCLRTHDADFISGACPCKTAPLHTILRVFTRKKLNTNKLRCKAAKYSLSSSAVMLARQIAPAKVFMNNVGKTG